MKLYKKSLLMGLSFSVLFAGAAIAQSAKNYDFNIKIDVSSVDQPTYMQVECLVYSQKGRGGTVLAKAKAAASDQSGWARKASFSETLRVRVTVPGGQPEAKSYYCHLDTINLFLPMDGGGIRGHSAPKDIGFSHFLKSGSTWQASGDF